MSKIKATHRGTCQACGALQKLPGGNLSTHGYTTRWGFFSGICLGTNAKPFEISKELIEHCIKHAESEIVRTQAEQARIRALVAPTAIVTYSCGAGYKHRQETEIKHTTNDQPGFAPHLFTFIDDRQKTRSIERFQLSGYHATLEDVCADLNARAARDLDSRIRELNSYIKWQRERIANWKPQPENLKPIK